MDQDERHRAQDQDIQEALGRIKHKILVMSGKGGVGKSSIAAYLAVDLAKRGFSVGLMDVDLHGPSIPRLLGVRGSIRAGAHGKAGPVEFQPKLSVMSIEVLMGEQKDTATIWRGPLKIGAIRQFISDIDWGSLDYLVVDSPPGTGDEPLTVAQTIPDAKALVVTTPQEISLADVRKSINFCRQVGMEILGLVENMSGLYCPHCGKKIDLFGSRGGEITAAKQNVRLLASLPIDPEVVSHGDAGRLWQYYEKAGAFNEAFKALGSRIVDLLSEEKDSPKKAEETIPAGALTDARTMIAVPVSEGKLCSHFGHCDQFALIETEGGKIIRKTMHTPPPHEPGVIPRWLGGLGVQVIIAGGMGSRAQALFDEKGIRVITGASAGEPEALVNQFLSSTLVTGANVCDH
jgi:Mrp family chromosome partitioning ATPase/predicted Fe-Mo cluster-binding NifX family protein